MANFEEAFNYMIQYEGTEFVDHPNDKGGATKFGISLRFLMGLNENDLLPKDRNLELWPIKAWLIPNGAWALKSYIEELTLPQAKWIYQKYFWLPIYEQIQNQDVANYIFDMHVNHGAKKAAELTQRAINASIRLRMLKVDGIFDDNVLQVLNHLFRDDDVYVGSKVVSCLFAVRESFYRCLVSRDTSQKVFLEGWLKRAYGEKL